jgi:methyl-branched lipid omega-hydroxylase
MSGAVSDVDLDRIDLSDPDVFSGGPPHELFARMRRETPVHWNDSADGEGFWSLTRAADIRAVSRDPETWSSAVGGVFIREDVPIPVELMRLIMLGMDPPLHTRHRMLVQKVFTPHTVNRQEDLIRARVNALIDRVCERGECDFVEELAVELPLQTIAEILGVPQEDRGRLFEWTNRIEAAHTDHTPDGLAAFGEMGEYLAALIAERREARSDDLISALMDAEVEGERLNDLEITSFFGLLMFAGNDTTRNTASGGLLALLEHPDQRRALSLDPQSLPGAIEEILRWVTPVMWFSRTATRDAVLRDVEIREGQKLVLWYASGSRDEELVSDPMEFDVTRPGVEHQAFGGGGRHFCLGASLARLQLRVLFGELLRRLPDVELAGAPVRLRSNWVNGLTSLPIRFTPKAPESTDR